MRNKERTKTPNRISPPASEAVRKFKMDPAKQAFLNGLIALLSLPFLIGVLTVNEPIIAIGIVTLPFAILTYFLSRKVYLEVGPTGIQLRNYKLSTFIPWSNFSQLLLVPASAGIELLQPVDEPWAHTLAGGNFIERMYGLRPSAYLAQLLTTHRFVELKPFRHLIKNGELATCICHYTNEFPVVTDLY